MALAGTQWERGGEKHMEESGDDSKEGIFLIYSHIIFEQLIITWTSSHTDTPLGSPLHTDDYWTDCQAAD